MSATHTMKGESLKNEVARTATRRKANVDNQLYHDQDCGLMSARSSSSLETEYQASKFDDQNQNQNQNQDGITETTPNRAEIRNSLEFIRPTGLQNLVAIAPEGGAPKSETFGLPDELDGATDWAFDQNDHGLNLYFTVNPVTARVTKKPTKGDIARADYAHVDIDPDPSVDYAEGRRRLLSETAPRLQAFTPPPSLIIDSGNGLGAFWRLELADPEGTEAINKQLIAEFGGDTGTHNIDRLMRLPGTLNYPTDKKISKGYPQEPGFARLLAANHDVCSAEDLAGVLPPAGPAVPRQRAPTFSGDATPLDQEDILDLDDRLAAALEKSPSLNRRWHGETDGLTDTSGSGFDFSITALLKSAGFSFRETAHLLRYDFKYGKGAKNTDRDLERNWSRCGAVSAAEIYTVCSEARKRGESWEERLYDADPSAQTVDTVLEKLSQEKGSPLKRALKSDYEVLAKDRMDEAAEQQVFEQAGNRLAVLWEPTAMNAMADRVEDALRTIPGRWEVLLYGGVHCRVAMKPPRYMSSIDAEGGTPPSIPVFDPYNRDSMLLRIEQSVAFYKKDHGKAVLIPVPEKMPQMLLNKPDPMLPTTSGLVSHPLVLPTGELLISEGLHERSGVYLHFGGGTFEAPGEMTPQEGLAILRSELLGEFPFATLADEAVALSLLLTAIERKTMDMAPGFMINAATQGSGKTTLARMIHVLVTGSDMPVAAMTENVDEQEKALLALLLQSVAIVCFDNVPDGFKVDSPALAKALTSPIQTGRILGISKMAELPTNTVFVVTGNNITASIDLTRRLLEVRLAPTEARPEQRRFKHPDVVAHVLRNRSRWMQAALAVLGGSREAHSATRPSGFQQWDRMVRWPLVNAGAADPVAKFDDVRDNSPDLERLTAWMLGLVHGFGVGTPFRASDLVRQIGIYTTATMGQSAEEMTRKSQMYGEYLDGHPPPKGWTNVKSISWMMSGLVERTIDGYKLTKKTVRGTTRYTIAQVSPAEG